MTIKKSYDIIGSNQSNPWFVMTTIMATDEWDASTQANDKYGMNGYKTVQESMKPVRPRNTKPYR